MRYDAERTPDSLPGLKVLRKASALAAVAALSLSLAAGDALAGDRGRHENDNGTVRSCESKIYGIVEKRPAQPVGVWIVHGRAIVVSGDTRIDEKHGRAELGAYIEVEGNLTGNTFTAYRIEVKQSRRSGRGRK